MPRSDEPVPAVVSRTAENDERTGQVSLKYDVGHRPPRRLHEVDTGRAGGNSGSVSHRHLRACQKS